MPLELQLGIVLSTLMLRLTSRMVFNGKANAHPPVSNPR
jgi:hypothetical protein